MRFLKIFFAVISLMIPMLLCAQQREDITLFKEKIKEKSDVIKGNNTFDTAKSFFLQEEWDSTLVHSMKQLNNPKISEELMNYCHFFRGYSFQQKKLFNEAEKEFKKVTKSFEFYNHSKVFLGGIALEKSEFEKAIKYFKAIEYLQNEEDLFLEESRVEHNIGVCYLHLKQFDKAEFYLLKSAKKQEIEKDTIQLVSSYGDLANLYYEQYKDAKAIPYFAKAYNLSKQTKKVGLKSTTALNMAIVEENQKNFSLALKYRKEHEEWKDSLNDQNDVWETVQIEKRFAIKDKQKEVNQLQLTKKIRTAERNGFIYASVILFLLLATGIYFYREKVKANKIIAAQKENLKELNATKDYLFSVVSHDLRSPVNAIRKQHKKLVSQIANKDFISLEKTADTAMTITESMYGLLNNVLHWSLEQSKQLFFKPQTHALEPIIEHVLFDFKNLASVKNIDIQTKLNASISANFDRESVKIILRNLIDNAIKYTPEKGTITIATTTSEAASHIEITDTGIGFTAAQIDRIHNLKNITVTNIDRSKGIGLGLLLCMTLIQKNNGDITIKSDAEQGSTIKIILPKT